jgi:alcohol/geraniol dehydrogenase (NADP+)
MTAIRAYAAAAPGAAFEPFTYEAGALGHDQVEIAVEHCGVCHSDLSMHENAWGMTAFPLVPGHEAIGRVVALGERVQGLAIGQRVGVGWNAGSCAHCGSCHAGDGHLCGAIQPTIVQRHGGFAERLRAQAHWTLPIPDTLDPAGAGPLLCGGITVFAPLLALGVRPTDRVGVIGIGGLGHLALKFARAWGCEVTAFTSSESKRVEAQALGAHRVLATNDKGALKAAQRSLDFIINTVNVSLDWPSIFATLAPKGRLHMVGALLEPLPLATMGLILGQQSVSGSPTGSRSAMEAMLGFAARHGIVAQVERYPMSKLNIALDHLRAGKARYRVVLDADFG